MLKAVLLKEAPQVVISIAVVCSRIVCLQFMRIQIETDCFQIAPLHISHLPAVYGDNAAANLPRCNRSDYRNPHCHTSAIPTHSP